MDCCFCTINLANAYKIYFRILCSLLFVYISRRELFLGVESVYMMKNHYLCHLIYENLHEINLIIHFIGMCFV